MTDKRKLVMATNNAGKLREARAIAGDRLEILSLSDIGFNRDIPETADSLAGNALLKVRAIKEVCDLDVFADDTGLLVDALGGAPGVYSARYAGDECDPEKNIDLLLKNLDGVADRKARFCTCIALSLDGEEHLFEGAVEGSIATKRSGSHGFGYDPIFVPDESGVCFAEMTDEAKNAISHRGRAVSAMMRWLSALCLSLLAFLPASAALSSDWTLYNTFDDAVEYVFDTQSKTYYLVHAQMHDPTYADNADKLCFLFCLEKDSDEVRPYNSQNMLSGSLIRTAYYNAMKKYLLIVYDDYSVDLLYDDGEVRNIQALRNLDALFSKEVRAISFDPERNLAYLATDFGFLAINDEKHEVAFSGIYGRPLDSVVRVGDWLLVLSDGKIYRDHADSNHLAFSDFEPVDWADGDTVTGLVSISSSKCMFAKEVDGIDHHYILTFADINGNPVRNSIGSFDGASIVENRDGLLLTRTAQMVQIDRNSGERTFYPRRGDDYAVPVGSWDMREAFFAKSRGGFYSLRRNDLNEWTVTREMAMPNAPSAFRSNFMAYVPAFGMMVNSHGIDQNFSAHLARNPILLSSLRDGSWARHGIPYFDLSQRFRLTNPCGFAQDPDNPDVFYFGSVLNGLIRYDIKDFSSLLHMTRGDDSPNLPGHVTVRDPYSVWSNAFILLNPRFDNAGNLLLAHCNTEKGEKNYEAELWIWTPAKRKASVSPETFQPFKVIKLDGLEGNKNMLALPLRSSSASSGTVAFFVLNRYGEPVMFYDHNGTPEDEADDRKVLVSEFFDQDGKLDFHYIYCALEDPATGLLWIGTDNGVFTLDPKIQFSDAGRANRIKVSRNDGTSLADYLLDGIMVNDIAIDANGRKWFALSGGGLVCTSSDGRSILKEVTSDNSMLPSDNVYAVCYNPASNSLMISTESGLCEHHLTVRNPSSSDSSVKVYPNPVRPDYYGWVNIEGLEDDCLVKITDAAGNIVRELGPASGGKVQWDACDSRLDRVASGVYFVLASSGPQGGSYGEVSKILVVKI